MFQRSIVPNLASGTIRFLAGRLLIASSLNAETAERWVYVLAKLGSNLLGSKPGCESLSPCIGSVHWISNDFKEIDVEQYRTFLADRLEEAAGVVVFTRREFRQSARVLGRDETWPIMLRSDSQQCR